MEVGSGQSRASLRARVLLLIQFLCSTGRNEKRRKTTSCLLLGAKLPKSWKANFCCFSPLFWKIEKLPWSAYETRYPLFCPLIAFFVFATGEEKITFSTSERSSISLAEREERERNKLVLRCKNRSRTRGRGSHLQAVRAREKRALL